MPILRLASALLLALALAGCGDDDDTPEIDAGPEPDGGGPGAPDAAGPDALGPTLSVTLAGSGAGRVGSSPGGIDCGDDCSEAYAPDTQVLLTAEAEPGSSFAGWTGACEEGNADAGVGTDPHCLVVMDGDQEVSATFAGGAPVGSVLHGGAGFDFAYAVAVDADGARAVAGSFTGPVDFGDGAVPGGGDEGPDIFVARYLADGSLDWVKTVGAADGDEDQDYDSALGVGFDGDGNVLAAGNFEDSINFGGAGDELGVLNLLTDVFIAKLSPEGDHIWSYQFGGPGYDIVYDAAVAPDGSIAVTGVFEDTADFGGLIPLIAAGGADVFIAKYDADGQPIWSVAMGGAGYDDPLSADIAFDDDGNVVYLGNFTGTVNYGGDDLDSAGGQDIVIARYAADDGAHLWSASYGSAGNDAGGGVAVSADGDPIAAVLFSGTVDLGGDAFTSAGGVDLALAQFAAADGAHVWSVAYGAAGDEATWAMARHPSGDLMVSGVVAGQEVDLGGGEFGSRGGNDGFAARYSPTGGYRWARAFGGEGNDIASDIAVGDAADGPVIAGAFERTVRFGDDEVDSLGGSDFFVVQLGP